MIDHSSNMVSEGEEKLPQIGDNWTTALRLKVGLRQLKDGYPKPAVRACRMIGEALVRWDEWPGENEWIISRARRLVAAAQAMWAGRPVAILHPRSAS